jgi:hypothetical protein
LKLVTDGPQQRLAADHQNRDAEKTRHVLGQRRDLSGFQGVVKEKEVDGEEAYD